MRVKGRVLLVNPWIYDFAAHNLWIEPLGLLTIGAVLADNGYHVTLLDCLAPHPGAPGPRSDGSGKFLKTAVEKPAPYASIPRRYGRYGMPLDQFDARLAAAPMPDLVLVASGMTYWYPGVAEAIQRIRKRWTSVPVAVGGIYATLCSEHASENSGADLVIAGPGVAAALQLAGRVTGHDEDSERYADPTCWPSPAHEMVPRPYAGVTTSWGCPYYCTYCASHRLQPAFVQRAPTSVLAEFAACVQRGVRDFAFYDDALLLGAGRHLVPILEGILARGWQVRLHTPNGLHAGEITADLALLMRRAGLTTVRLSLETVEPARQQSTGAKISTAAFSQAVSHMLAAGFEARDLGSYILAGLPGQPLSETEATVRFVHRLGVQAKLALFSPIPGTPEGDRALPASADPLLHNNTAHPYTQGPDYVLELQRIKQLAKDGNAALAAGP
ncbi:MAG: cobalamin-dependent protein [Anaerolineae bacterium]|jgi:radical SAM superfamily enzyme YgiQ (UPF0313 family)